MWSVRNKLFMFILHPTTFCRCRVVEVFVWLWNLEIVPYIRMIEIFTQKTKLHQGVSELGANFVRNRVAMIKNSKEIRTFFRLRRMHKECRIKNAIKYTGGGPYFAMSPYLFS